MLAVPETNPGPQTGLVDTLATVWADSGKHVETPLSTWTCAIIECRTLAFVVLKTRDGNKPVCLKHFDEIRANAGLHAAHKRGHRTLTVRR